MAFRPEEEHARLLLSGELGMEFRHYDAGSSPRMPDLLSSDGMHVAEVITTAPPAVRKAQKEKEKVSFQQCCPDSDSRFRFQTKGLIPIPIPLKGIEKNGLG